MNNNIKESSLIDCDEIDLKILRSLQKDARISNSQLAKEVNLSETPCWRRWKKLEEKGYIQEYRALMDRRKLGYGVVAFTQVSFLSHDVALTDEFENTIKELEWVQTCHCVTGSIDYLVKMVAHDLDEFSERNTYLRHIPGVHSVQSHISVKEIKDSSDMPV